ncbi:flagellar hook-length control protein FliK [Vogesella sp. GCM10023246]|uniref:Flagellar hook-length control protein FliK n=1 Tax=Vogesella oryzagri TaxID=3160864 RepID=A0ABV1LZH1_9NEIS
MAHAISPANKAVPSAPTASSAAAGQPADNSIFTMLLSQLQPAGSAEDGLSSTLGDLLTGGDDKALSGDLAVQPGADAMAALQLLMQGYNPQQQLAGSRQQLPEAAAFADQALPDQAAMPAQILNALHLQQTAGDKAAAAKPQAPGQQGIEQALGRLSEALQQQSAPATPPATDGARRSDVLPSNVRLLFRPEQHTDVNELSDGNAIAQTDSSQSMLSQAANSLLPHRGHDNWQEIRQPMTPGSSAWRQEFAEKLGNLVQFKLDSASIKVSPEHLGPLDISITFDPQDKARISVVAANHAAREIVESGLPQLGKMLEQSGIQVGSVEVSSQSQQQQGRDSGAQWQQGQQQGQHRGQQQEPFLPQTESGVPALSGDSLAGSVAAAVSEQLSIRA